MFHECILTYLIYIYISTLNSLMPCFNLGIILFYNFGISIRFDPMVAVSTTIEFHPVFLNVQAQFDCANTVQSS